MCITRLRVKIQRTYTQATDLPLLQFTQVFHDSTECVKYQRNNNLVCRCVRLVCLVECFLCYKGHEHCAERSCYDCHKLWIPSCSHLQMGFPNGDYCTLKSSILMVKTCIQLNHSFYPSLFVWRVEINVFLFSFNAMSESNYFIVFKYDCKLLLEILWETVQRFK